MKPPEIGIGATFSECNTFRFSLWRIWDLSKPLGMFIGLNPSTANQKSNDPTITRLSGTKDKPGLAPRNGLGGFYMMNLYPFVTPYPDDLERAIHMLPENDLFLQEVSAHCQAVIFCWGAFETFGRAEKVKQMFAAAKCFGKNKDGSPKHPLYLAAKTKLIDF